MASIQVNGSDFRNFDRALRAAIPSLRAGMVRNMRAAGQLVAGEYRSRAYSKQGTTGVSTARSSVTVTVKGPVIVYLEELQSGGWDHPTFGHGPKVRQASHPALKPALDAKGPEAFALITQAVDEAFDRAAHL